MEHKDIAALETELEVLKRDMKSCQNDLHKDFVILKNQRAEVPNWVKSSSAAIILAIFTQTIASVWWASAVSTNVANLQREVSLNTEFRMEFPKMHEAVMLELGKLSSQNSHLTEKINTIKKVVIGTDGLLPSH